MRSIALQRARALHRCSILRQSTLAHAAATRLASGQQLAYTASARLCLSRDTAQTEDLLNTVQSMFRNPTQKDEEEEPTSGKGKGTEQAEQPKRRGRPVVARSRRDLDKLPAELVWRATDATKEALYEDYISDPETYTLKALADKYMLNPARVKVIIHHMEIREQEMKRAEAEAEDDSIPEDKKFKLFWDFEKEADREAYRYLNGITGMYGAPRSDDDTLDVDEDDPFARPEPLIYDKTAESNPAFRVVSDDEVERFYDRIAEEAVATIPEVTMEKIPDTPATVLRADRELKSRTKFIFTDTSHGANCENRDIRVREKDGTLRTASGEERYWVEKVHYPSKRNTRLF